MFLEFHGYIIDPKSRYLDLKAICKDCFGWKQFTEWKPCSEGIKCDAGWMAITAQNHRYLLAQYPGLIIEYFDGSRKEITWTGDPPQYIGCVIS